MTVSTFDFTALIDGLETTHKVRVVTLDGAPWFVAKDVCDALGLAVSKGGYGHHLMKLAADERRLTPRTDIGIGGKGGPLALVSEPGLYRLIVRSDKPIARPFQDWVTREVLPAIRKTGGYVLAGADPATVEVGATEMMPLPATFTEALRQHAATLIRLAEEQGASRRRDWEALARTQAEKQAAEEAKATINWAHNSLSRDRGDHGRRPSGGHRTRLAMRGTQLPPCVVVGCATA